jgi:hypothetical protein
MREVSVLPPSNEDTDTEWSWKYEQRYGAPKLADRESALSIALDVLSNGGKDLQPIRERAIRERLLEPCNALKNQPKSIGYRSARHGCGDSTPSRIP